MYKENSLKNYQEFWNKTGQPYAFLLPALFVFVFVVLSPVIMSLILSFYKFTGFDANIFKEFIGFENFKILFRDKYFWISFKNTFYFVASSITIQILLSLVLAITIFFGRFKNSISIRTIIFFPAVLAPVSISLA